VERLETDNAGLSEILVAIQRPGWFKLFAKVLLEFLQASRCKKVLAVKRILESEEIEDCREELAAFCMREVADNGGVGAEPIFLDDLVEIKVIDDEQATLFQIREYDPPTAPEIGDGAVEEICLKCLVVVPTNGCEGRLLVAIAVVAERESKRAKHGFADSRVG
jgi:hypothetical protein